MQSATIKTSIFPESDNSYYFVKVNEKKNDARYTAAAENGTVCRIPHGYRAVRQLAGLMTLGNFIQGGSGVSEAKVLVCIKGIEARRNPFSLLTMNGKSVVRLYRHNAQ